MLLRPREPNVHRLWSHLTVRETRSWANEVKRWLPGKLHPIVITSDLSQEKRESRITQFLVSKYSALLLISCAAPSRSTRPLNCTRMISSSPRRYETLQRNIERFKKQRGGFGLLVCDEAHRLKNCETIQFKAM